jgi:non-specific serine/threonine protein kinase/serine/threonine-protein kinase
LQHELAVAYGKIGDVQGRPMFPNLGRMPDALRSYQRSLALLQSAAAACPESLGIQRDLVVTMQRLGDVLGRMGRREEGMKLELEAKQHVLAQRALHPDEPLLVGDLGVATDRLSDLKFAAGDTLGAVKEIGEGNDALEQLYQKNPKDAAVRRSMMVGYAKLARLLEQHDRSRAGDYYAKSQNLAEQAVREFPNNTDASRDLGIVYSWRSLFMAQGGSIDSALALHERGTRISEDLAASDPDDVLQQADLANGHFEVGTILMKGGRYPQAEESFAEAYRRFARLAAHDSSNAETRVFLARTSRQAGEACQKASRSAGREEAVRWKLRAKDWLQKSLAHYRQLGKDGALTGQDVAAPVEISNQLAALQGSVGGDPDSSR